MAARRPRRGYVTPMTEAVPDTSLHPARMADAMQAAYFRGVLSGMRAEIEATLAKAGSRRQTYEARGDRMTSQRLRHEIRGQEYELSQLDWLIARLDRRCSALWPELAAETG